MSLPRNVNVSASYHAKHRKELHAPASTRCEDPPYRGGIDGALFADVGKARFASVETLHKKGGGAIIRC